jgi:hypothetical protein
MMGAVRFLRSQGPSLVALFVALGGTAYAAGFPANVVGTKQLKANAVTQPKLASNAVDGSKIADDSIAGADVRQRTLWTVATAAHADTAAQATAAASAGTIPSIPSVPSAANADDSSLLGGLAPAAYQRLVTGSCNKGIASIGLITPGQAACGGAYGGSGTVVNAGTIQISSSPGNLLNIVLTCHFGGKVTVGIKNITSADGTLNWFYSDGTTVNASGTLIPASGAIQEFSFAGKRIEGQFIAAASGMVNTIKIHALDFGGACEYQTMMLGAE